MNPDDLPRGRPENCDIEGCTEDPFGWVGDEDDVDWYCIDHFKKYADWDDDGGDIVIG